MQRSTEMTNTDNPSKIIWVALLSSVVVVTTVAALVLAIDFVLLIFLGLLFGVFLTKTTKLLQNKFIPIGYGWNLGIVVLFLILICISGIFLFGAQIEDRLSKTSEQLDNSVEHLEKWLDEYPMAATAFRKIPFSDQLRGVIEDSADSKELSGQPPSSSQDESNSQNQSREDESATEDGDQSNQDGDTPDIGSVASSDVIRNAAGRVFRAIGKLLSTTFGLLANAGVIFFIGVFVATDPTLYRDGFAQLFPPKKRDRVIEVMNLMGEAMYAWLKGRFLTMLITGAGTAIALLIIGVPMSITIGVITGLLTFIPNIGAIASLGLAILMALPLGPMTVAWVVIAYSVLQLIESNIITPLIQQHQTSIPPALLLAFQILMAALTGILGVMVATPLLAGGIVLIKEAWIKDVLENGSAE